MGAFFDPLLGQLQSTDPPATFISNGSIKQTIYNVRDYGAVGDGSTNDSIAIQAAINAAQSAGGGTVFFSAGTYVVSSTSRTDTITGVSGSTFSDASASTGDVGSYVIGATQTGALKIVSVVAGVSFTTDYAPGTTSVTQVNVVKPGLVLPPSVTLKGSSVPYTANNFGTGESATSRIKDNGTGICILIRGAYVTNATWQSGYSIENLSIWGYGSGTPQWGIFIANGAWFCTIKQCEIGYFQTANLGLDGNINSVTVSDTMIIGGGISSASTKTGGCITHPYWSQPSSSLIFINCFFNQNYGWGLTGGSTVGSFGVVLFGCQFNNTIATSATNSGTSAALQSHGDSDGNATIYGGWSESAAKYDLYLTGPVLVSGMTFSSSAVTNHWYVNSGNPIADACVFQNTSNYSVALNSGANISWRGIFTTDSAGFYNGGPTGAVLSGMGTSSAIFASKIGGNMIPTQAVSVAGNFQLQDLATSPNKAYEFRTDGSDLDFQAGGANMTFSVWDDPAYTTNQITYMVMGKQFNFVTLFKYWEWKDDSFNVKFYVDPNNKTVHMASDMQFDKVNIQTGSNKSAGTGTLSGGTATISTTAVTANSLIFLTDTASSLTNVGVMSVTAKTAGTSFTVTSTNVLDSSTFNYLIIN